MRPQTGLILRMVGMLIEFLCAAGILATRGRSTLIAGLVPLNIVLYVGLAFGLGLVIAGNVMVKRFQPTRQPASDANDETASLKP
ncbi:MAG: hypothetical protein ABI353_08205 [Isosphaeraceae bacterium]